MIAELQRVASLLPKGTPLTSRRFNEHARVDASTVKRHFGGWAAALDAAGILERYSGRTVSPKMKTQLAREMSDDELLAELVRVAARLGTDILTQPQFNSHSEVSASAMSGRFGSWNRALASAGLKPTRMGRRYTEDDYFENLLEVWTHYGRQPTYGEMELAPSRITPAGYAHRWGSWTKALQAFVERMNSDAPEPEVLSTPAATGSRSVDSVPVAERRKIPLALRYQVLRRDSFKCGLCGNSPALDPSCVLHVDHVVPFSRGGKTVEGNLRALCAACNLGKSDGD
jgi:hypothetical protein